MDTISKFIAELKKQKNTATIFNPYLEPEITNNLIAYLKLMLNIEGKRILLIGEAPGYKGCKITGIPFSSGKVFERIDHPILRQLKGNLMLSKIEAENTATIVWNYLATKNTTPLFWNSFPFHPHPKGNANKNRAPTNQEIDYGVKFLHALNKLFKPGLIAGIGNSGFNCAKRAFPDSNIL